ncbi:MAG: DUF429 domain-containing protein [Anaerolineae bacterium]|nr:DUF429 domain-containing protein [Anaerolineae bacterium]
MKNTLFIGIDPTSGTKEFGYAVVDANLNLVKIANADMDELADFLANQESAVVAINSPAQVNKGLVKKHLENINESPGHSFRGVDMRFSEFELHAHGISIASTPAREELCPSWMQVGFKLYRKLSELNYKSYSAEYNSNVYLETHPYACFCVLLETIPFPKPALEGRLQRQLVLFEHGLKISDAMDFFEEVTRFKLLKGNLPLDTLYGPDQLDVLAAAFTAWLSVQRPDEVTSIGNKNEGEIILPVKKLMEKYS